MDTSIFNEIKRKFDSRYFIKVQNNSEIVAVSGGHEIRFKYEGHSYTVDGIPVPSVTQLIKKFGPNIYGDIPQHVLENAARKGTRMHNEVELFENEGIDCGSQEVRGYKKLKAKYNIQWIGNEILIALFDGRKPVCAGRLDFIYYTGSSNSVGICDLKRTYKYNSETVTIQLNFYRLGFKQCFGIEVSELSCLRLRERIAERHEVFINDSVVNKIISKVKFLDSCNSKYDHSHKNDSNVECARRTEFKKVQNSSLEDSDLESSCGGCGCLVFILFILYVMSLK